MKVLLYNSGNQTKNLVEYPRKDKKPVIDLAINLEYYELQETDKPVYNPLQYNCNPYYVLTDSPGEFLKICLIEWLLVEKQQSEVIEMLNESLGNHIDTNYPLWEQNKHSGKAIRFLQMEVKGETPTQEEIDYIIYVEACVDWAAGCRTLRDDYENEYINTGVLPSIIWPERPVKQ